jgi:hypothetical protein
MEKWTIWEVVYLCVLLAWPVYQLWKAGKWEWKNGEHLIWRSSFWLSLLVIFKQKEGFYLRDEENPRRDVFIKNDQLWIPCKGLFYTDEGEFETTMNKELFETLTSLKHGICTGKGWDYLLIYPKTNWRLLNKELKTLTKSHETHV